ncbi:hypothetical protein [Cryobacterium psychrophilum]|uniref:hypothetical protein n=1 Tax=Cryobacterium psychrophilum TaxID=41988 RepID=UPI001F53F1FE|nr:hypothetical protein [Cryobacterium psychrophilum]
MHGENLQELTLLAGVGMSLKQVLAATTSIAGELITPVGSVGRLAPTSVADVVLNGTLNSVGQLNDLPRMIERICKDGRNQFPVQAAG